MQDIPRSSAEAKAAAAAGELLERLTLVADRRALTADCAAGVSMDTDNLVLFSKQLEEAIEEEAIEEEARECSPAVDTPTVASEPRRMASASLAAALRLEPDVEEEAGAAAAATPRPLQTKRQRISPLPQPPATRRRTAQHCHQHQHQHQQTQQQRRQQLQQQQQQQITALPTGSDVKLEGLLSQEQLLLQSTASMQVLQGALLISSVDARCSPVPSDDERHPTRSTSLPAAQLGAVAACEVDGPPAAAVPFGDALLHAQSPPAHQPCSTAQSLRNAPGHLVSAERRVISQRQAPSDLPTQQLQQQPLLPEVASSREARLEEEDTQLRPEIKWVRQEMSLRNGVAKLVGDGPSGLNKQLGQTEVLGQAITPMASLAPPALATLTGTTISGLAAGPPETQPQPVLVRSSGTPRPPLPPPRSTKSFSSGLSSQHVEGHCLRLLAGSDPIDFGIEL